MEGTLVLVVGPSGAGKDSVMDSAKTALADDARFVFARRTITRPADAGGEVHDEATQDAFATAQAAGAFCLSWKAHGFDYGIPTLIEEDLAARRCVIANVSRSVLDLARDRYRNVRIVNITAPAEILAQRIALRGREDEASVRKRLARAAQDVPVGDDVFTIENTGALQDAVDAFTALLRQCQEGYLSAVST